MNAIEEITEERQKKGRSRVEHIIGEDQVY